MFTELEQTAKTIQEATERRNELIVAFRKQGVSFRTLAEHSGLSYSRVFQLCKEADGE